MGIEAGETRTHGLIMMELAVTNGRDRSRLWFPWLRRGFVIKIGPFWRRVLGGRRGRETRGPHAPCIYVLSLFISRFHPTSQSFPDRISFIMVTKYRFLAPSVRGSCYPSFSKMYALDSSRGQQRVVSAILEWGTVVKWVTIAGQHHQDSKRGWHVYNVWRWMPMKKKNIKSPNTDHLEIPRCTAREASHTSSVAIEKERQDKCLFLNEWQARNHKSLISVHTDSFSLDQIISIHHDFPPISSIQSSSSSFKIPKSRK